MHPADRCTVVLRSTDMNVHRKLSWSSIDSFSQEADEVFEPTKNISQMRYVNRMETEIMMRHVKITDIYLFQLLVFALNRWNYVSKFYHGDVIRKLMKPEEKT